MTPSRAQPSRRFRDLLALYRQMHLEGVPEHHLPPERTFAGTSLRFHMSSIRKLLQESGAKTLLDYGSGKGTLYDLKPLPLAEGATAPSLAEHWGLASVRCYDPGFPAFAERPAGTFDAVICIDVLEHCPDEDIAWILDEVFGFARRAAFFCIASYPARKSLPNGENAHITVRPPAWWAERLEAAADARPGVRWLAVVEELDGGRVVHGRFIGAATPG